MKKVISSLMIAGMMTFGFVNGALAQDGDSTEAVEATTTEMANEADSIKEEASPVAEAIETETEAPAEAGMAEEKAPLNFTGTLKQKFIEGDPFWMSFVLICLVIGMALCIERIVYLNLASINTNKFLEDVEAALSQGGVAQAKELCRNTRGPIASIFYQGLDRADEGIEMVEKSVVSYGGVQMGQLEKGVSWISLFIALAPMLGFMGTVIGMIFAFDKIVEDGQVSPTTVAAGIKVALLTTVFGLIAAIFLQIFYNYIVSKIDGLVNEMENASISLVDMMLKYKITSK
ncbi:MotA/TolQ/ExbB proton channel family protein [Lishizhenia sp.]|uniref:MotA/TolQ/ExbB proton channel family protein n=1 Tax=Lishizhenia sp. TaxID=2497594 RepID=UPI00299F1225|nr:MotA/TolQ/ExbB proton channel family protein [Lishizhenia sp.]MDX1445951.1 MotA/TolQ/ExbB proton channel family protein [Lishizhenia sp.]